MSNEVSNEVATKIDRLCEHVERLTAIVESHEKALYGTQGDFGLAHQVKLIWRIHVWVLCSLSAVAGSVLTGIVMTWVNR